MDRLQKGSLRGRVGLDLPFEYADNEAGRAKYKAYEPIILQEDTEDLRCVTQRLEKSEGMLAHAQSTCACRRAA